MIRSRMVTGGGGGGIGSNTKPDVSTNGWYGASNGGSSSETTHTGSGSSGTARFGPAAPRRKSGGRSRGRRRRDTHLEPGYMLTFHQKLTCRGVSDFCW